MQFDQQAFRQKFLKHCLWMANFDKDHALRAAANYERDCEILYGLYDRVKLTIERQTNSKIEPSNASTEL